MREHSKGIIINASYREDESWTWDVEDLILGRLYKDGSFGKLIRLYTDDTNTFQMEFLKGSDVAYTFLPECTELLDMMKEGITGVSLGMMADELMQHGWKEVMTEV